MSFLLDILQNLPSYLHLWAVDYGVGLYFIVAAIIFAETGLVVAPLLPGDSLLFAVGALLALDLPGLNLVPMICILIMAALAGDTVNYFVGQWMAKRLFTAEARWLNRKHLERTQEFYAKHGGKTIIIARFMPIVRTYAPFVAGLSGITYRRFIGFSITGGVLWISLFTLAGYFFGNIPAIKTNFHYAILAICVISVAPVVIEYFKSRRQVGNNGV